MKFAILAKPGLSTFVKTYDAFVEQGGTREKWGEQWTVIDAVDVFTARKEAIRRSGFAGLYCAGCGHEAPHDCYCKQPENSGEATP